jgi:hypothetical protein
MYFRSTGLGKTELTGKVNDMQRQGDYIVMYVDIIDPVKWRVRAAFSFSDLAIIAGKMAKAAILSLVFSPKQWRNKEPKHPGDF